MHFLLMSDETAPDEPRSSGRLPESIPDSLPLPLTPAEAKRLRRAVERILSFSPAQSEPPLSRKKSASRNATPLL